MRTIKLTFPSNIPLEQISVKFLQGMIDRMAIGYYNYGPIKDNFPHNYDAMKSYQIRIKKYKETKNTEFLMDAANYMMIEFARPKLKGAKFSPTTKDESPGAVLNNGKISKGKEHFDPAKDSRRMFNI